MLPATAVEMLHLALDLLKVHQVRGEMTKEELEEAAEEKVTQPTARGTEVSREAFTNF